MTNTAIRLGMAKLEVAYRDRFNETEADLIREEFGELGSDEWLGVVGYTITTYSGELPTVVQLWALVREYTTWRLLREDRAGGEKPAWKRLLDDAGL